MFAGPVHCFKTLSDTKSAPICWHGAAPLLMASAAAVAIMRKLRQTLHDSDPLWTHAWHGWQPGGASHPCTWANVACNAGQRVTSL
jgi:hypothetical protein